MRLIRVIPTLLIENGNLVKTIRFKKPKYIGDPINAVKIFNTKEVDELVLIDISKNKNELNFNLISEIVSEAFMPVAYGGGIKNLSQIEKLFKIGVDKIIINSHAFINPELIKMASLTYGNQSIVLSVDIKKDFFNKKHIYINNGKKKIKGDYLGIIENISNQGAGEIILNSIDHDGMMNGYDYEIIKNVSNKLNIPLVCLGGAGKKEDLLNGIENGASAVAAGSLFVFSGIHKAVLISYIKSEILEKDLK